MASHDGKLIARSPVRKRRLGPSRRGRIRDRKYLAFIAAQPCMISGEVATVHHVREFGSPKDDHRTLPLALRFHLIGASSTLSIEALGKVKFEQKYGVNLELAIAGYNEQYRRQNTSKALADPAGVGLRDRRAP